MRVADGWEDVWRGYLRLRTPHGPIPRAGAGEYAGLPRRPPSHAHEVFKTHCTAQIGQRRCCGRLLGA